MYLSHAHFTRQSFLTCALEGFSLTHAYAPEFPSLLGAPCGFGFDPIRLPSQRPERHLWLASGVFFFFFPSLPLPSLTLLPLPLLPFLFGFVLSYRGRPLRRESGVWLVRKSHLYLETGEVWEVLLIEVFGDQGLVWNVLFVIRGRARVVGRGLSRRLAGDGVELDLRVGGTHP